MTDHIRVPLIEPGTDPALAEIEATIRAERGGTIPVLYQALLNSPAIAAGWEQMLTAVRNRTGIPADLRELIILRVAVLNNASFEFAAHLPPARAAGVSEEKIEAVRSGDLSVFSEDERTVLALTEQMTRDIEVDQAIVADLSSRYGVDGVVEFTAAVAAYNMVSRFLVAMSIH